MCRDKESDLKSQIKDAKRLGAHPEEIRRLETELYELIRHPYYDPDREDDLDLEVDDWPDLEKYHYHHVNGYARPWMLIYTSVNPIKVSMAKWSFVAPDVETVEEAYNWKSPKHYRNLNAQSEKMFTSRTFNEAAKYGRCVIKVESYYEYHHSNKYAYPFRIKRNDSKPLYIAGICRRVDLIDSEDFEHEYTTFASLTCKANTILSKIHNEPKMVARNGHRMLAILDDHQLEAYLRPYPIAPEELPNKKIEEAFQKEILELLKPFDDDKLAWHTVRKLQANKEMGYLGNVPEIKVPYHYDHLDYTKFKD